MLSWKEMLIVLFALILVVVGHDQDPEMHETTVSWEREALEILAISLSSKLRTY